MTGECVGNTAQLKINVDITKPLKNIIVLKEENDEEEGNRNVEEMEGEDENAEVRDRTVTEVQIPVVYER